jgi:hypothetical protein
VFWRRWDFGFARVVTGACAVVASIALGVCLARAQAAGAASWSIQRTPTAPGATEGAFSGVSCPSPTACTAVGHFTDALGFGDTLAERWNGTSWRIQRTPRPGGATSSLLFDVSCASPRSCTAVGSATEPSGITVPLAERWNGRSWSIQPTPRPLANGGRVAYLGGVSCASTKTCVAVGFSGNRAGTRGRAIAERWNGTGWTIERTAQPSGAAVSFLSALSCPSPRSCTAAGYLTNRGGLGETLVERWNGTSWTVQPTPTPTGATLVQLVGVSCAEPSVCTAVGYFSNITGIDVMLAEHWNGVSWSIERTRYPAGARYVRLAGVSCPSPMSCAAVGLFNNVTGIDVTLSERSRGGSWSIQHIPYPAGATATTLQAVSCVSPTRCIAVGGFYSRAGTGSTLAERYS